MDTTTELTNQMIAEAAGWRNVRAFGDVDTDEVDLLGEAPGKYGFSSIPDYLHDEKAALSLFAPGDTVEIVLRETYFIVRYTPRDLFRFKAAMHEILATALSEAWYAAQQRGGDDGA